QSVREWKWLTLAIVRIGMGDSVQIVSGAKTHVSRSRNNGTALVTAIGGRPLLNCASGQRDQVGRVAAIERQFENALVFYDRADANSARFHHRCIRLDFDLFGNLPNLHDGIDECSVIDLQHNACLNKRSKSRQGGFKPIGSESQIPRSLLIPAQT